MANSNGTFMENSIYQVFFIIDKNRDYIIGAHATHVADLWLARSNNTLQCKM